jgi:hypothetical protein
MVKNHICGYIGLLDEIDRVLCVRMRIWRLKFYICCLNSVADYPIV